MMVTGYGRLFNMSKLDRELKAIIDDMGAQAEQLLPKMLVIMIDEDIEDDKKMAELSKMMSDAKPKTYDVYIRDMKQVFREAGWIEP